MPNAQKSTPADLGRLSGEKWHNNPRTITDKEMAFLKECLEELGDLSGVVHDLNTNQYVGGNQRSQVFGEAAVELVETFDPPTATGTVALGYILHEGEKYQYRQVRWTQEQCRKANIVANSAGGKWDMDMLANEWSDLPLDEWGVPVPSDWLKEPEEEDGGGMQPTESSIKIVFGSAEQAQKAQAEFQKLLEKKYEGATLTLTIA